MISTNILTADFSQEMSNVFLKAKQYDNLSRKYKIRFADNGILKTPTTSAQIRIRMQAEGESTPYVDKWFDEVWEDGLPVFTFTANMLSKIGKVYIDFSVQEPGNAEAISTRQQTLLIQRSLVNYDGIISSSDFDVLSHLIAEAATIPDLIEDVTTTKEEVEALITSVNSQMATYQTEFTQMSTDVQNLLTEVHAYMEDVENAAASSAKLSESFAHGGTNTRPGEDGDNAAYYKEQAQSEADRAKSEADRAASYASMTAPTLRIDPDTMELIQEQTGTGITLTMDEDKVLSFTYTT